MLWPPDSEQYPLVPSTEQVDADTEKCLAAPLWGESQKLTNQAVIEGEITTVAAKEKLDTDARTLRDEYLDLQKPMNAVSFSAPSCLSACTELDLDPAAPYLPLLPNMLTPRAASTVRELKPWQVHFLSWARQMEKTRLKS